MGIKKFGYGDFYCTFCGSRMEKNAAGCPNCGKPYGDSKYNGINQMGAGGIGYSDKANDPCFKAYSRKSAKFGFVFLIIVSIIIAAVLLIGEHVSITNAAAVVGIIWAIDIIWFIASTRKKKDWEGVVESKNTYTETKRRSDDNGSEDITYTEVYKVVFRTTDGKKQTLKDYNNSSRYDYFRQGDRLRFIGSLRYYEKYDKSHDPFIPCAGCASERDVREDYCGKCGCVMLKGKPVSVKPVYQPQSDQQRKFCPQCGAQVKSGAKFCENCGQKLTEEQ